MTKEIDVNAKRLVVASLATILIAAGGSSVAAGVTAPHEQPAQGVPAMSGSMMGNMGANGAMGPMGGGMMGMMGGGMMGGMMGGYPPMAQVSPANERLAMRMRGEMMQAMGAILIKYADKFQPQPAK